MKNLALTEQELNKKSDIENRYAFYKKHSDPSMGEISLLKDSSTNDVICFKEQIKNSKQQFAQAIMEARERLKLNHSYLIEMKDYSTKQTNDFCSTFYTIRTFYEYQMNNLQKEIKHRKDRGIDFTMIELTHQLYNISEACAYLQDRGKSHGDIRPSSIAVLEEGKKYKLIDRADTSTPAFTTQQNYLYSCKDLYVTPQTYAALKRNQQKPNENEYKSDVFSFGLCILEAGLKRGVGSIYTENSFNPQELNKLLDEFHRKYEDNPLLVTTLRKMLAVDEAERPDFKTIINAIPSYTEIIEFFKGDDQYYDNDDFTNSQYLDDMGGNAYDHGANDYHQDPGYAGQHPQNMQQGQGFPHQQPAGYQQDAGSQYGQLVGNYASQNGLAQQTNQGQMYQPQTQAGMHQQQGYAQNQPNAQNPYMGAQPGAQSQYDQQQFGYQQQPQMVPQQQLQPLFQPQQLQPQPQQLQPQQLQPQGYGQFAGQQSWSSGQQTLAPQQTQMMQSQPMITPQQLQVNATQPSYAQTASASQQQTAGSQPSAIKHIGSNTAGGVASQQMYQPTASATRQPASTEGDIQVIGGRRYREVKETKTELNEFGQQIKKVIVKLQPLDDNVKKVEPNSSLSSQGGISGASTNYGGFTGGYNAGGAQGGYSAGTQGGYNGYSAQSGYRQ